jgi:peptidoglycan L-alanyl-D-glutamate endopeptidase CwlK
VPEFSARSKSILLTCHPALQAVMVEVVKTFDCTVICGRRSEAEQEKAFNEGKSKAHFGESAHNFPEALAVDVVPYPIDWQDLTRMAYFAGHVMKQAEALGVKLTWGGDWDRDTQLSDNRFNDFPHFELADWRQRTGRA